MIFDGLRVICRQKLCLAALMIYMMICVFDAYAESARIKDLVGVRGVRSNQLVGFGLVVGLNASGDSSKSLATNKAFANMLQSVGMNVPLATPSPQNVAAVMVTGELGPSARIGDKLSIRVSAVGDAKGISGGTLILTPLRAADGKVYAVAQGPVSIPPISPNKNVATIVDGATVEREHKSEFVRDGIITLSLKQPDFTNAIRISDQINALYRDFIADVPDSSTIMVKVPPFYDQRETELLSEIEALEIEVDQKAKVILSQRTGTVVIGHQVRISDISISHGSLSIRVGQTDSEKKTPVAEQRVAPLKGNTVADLVKGLNALGVKPDDLVSIFEAIERAGALHGDLVIH